MINTFNEVNGVDFSDDKNYPCRAILWGASGKAIGEPDSTVYGFAQESAILECEELDYTYLLQAGMYFSATGPIVLRGGKGVLIERFNYRGLFNLGGPIEEKGRLRYIDGCTDTLLVNPPRLGDPCLNHLHFPPNIKQTMHTHPTVRIGIVTSGQGRCVTPDGEYPLVPGIGWFLPVNGAHCFYTDDESMDVIAWHPDSDTGPNDEDHPMLNRTYVENMSARFLDDIKTSDAVEVAK